LGKDTATVAFLLLLLELHQTQFVTGSINTESTGSWSKGLYL